MKMLSDLNEFQYKALVPWPQISYEQQDWVFSVETLESWLAQHIGSRYQYWAWDLSPRPDRACVSFRYDPHRLMFVLTWSL